MSAHTPSIAGVGDSASARQTLAYVAFGIVYYALAAYATSLPFHAKFPQLIWPAHGLALGTLLVAPIRRWPAYIALILVGTVAAGLDMHAGWMKVVATMGVNAIQPVIVAAGLQRLAGPRVQIDTLQGVGALLIGIVPLVGVM